jgi:hypothetical protein
MASVLLGISDLDAMVDCKALRYFCLAKNIKKILFIFLGGCFLFTDK